MWPEEAGKLVALSAKGQAREGSLSVTHKETDTANSDNCVNIEQSIVCTNDFINLLAVNPAQAYHVIGIVSGVRVSFMLDTGASVSLLSESMWESINANDTSHELKHWTGSQLVGVDGSTLVIRGETTINITLAGRVVTGDVLVAGGLGMPAILGLDFLEKNSCVINTEQRVLHMHGRAIPLHCDSRKQSIQHSEPTITAALQETIKIPPLSEIEVLAVTSNSINDVSTWLMEELPNEKKVLIATAVVVPQNDGTCTTVPVRLANLSADSLIVYKGTKLGQMTKLESDLSIASVTPETETHASTPPLDIPCYKREVIWDLVTKSGNALKEQQQHELYNLLLGFADVIMDADDGLGQTNVLQHTISTGNAAPIRQPPRRAPPYQKETVRELLDGMLRKGIIQPSKSPWASPVVLVKKKDGSTRFCVDYRKLNAVIEKDAYPLPRIDDTLDTLCGSQWFSTLDLLSGYWQVEMEERDREKTAFTTHEGLFEFKVMPFGLCNAPATFQRLMNIVLAGIQWSRCLVYLDDVIVVGRTFREHLENLGIVLQRLREANLRLKPAKCFLCRDEVLYLGHIVSRNGIATDPSKTDNLKLANSNFS